MPMKIQWHPTTKKFGLNLQHMHLELDETANRTARVPHMQKWVWRRPSDMGPHLH
jgi:hypothetical protein